MAIAVFNYAVWTARYPEFASVTEPVAQSYFDEATLYLDNTDCSPVDNAGQRLVLLNMLTAHVASLSKMAADQGGVGAGGRVTGATEGTVSITRDYFGSDEGAWFNQSPYGAAFWQATISYRSATYVPGFTRDFDVYAPWASRGYWGW